MQRAVLVEREAVPVSGQAPLVRPGDKPHDAPPQDNKIPVHSFQHDFLRKLSIRRTMGKPDDEAELGESPQVYDKEDVNYRYSGTEGASCGDCKFFVKPGACRLVSGLIRPTDTCDKFQARTAGAEQGAVTEQFDGYGDGMDGGDGGDGCADEEKDMDGRCPGDMLFDEYTQGMYDPSFAGEAEGLQPVRARIAEDTVFPHGEEAGGFQRARVVTADDGYDLDAEGAVRDPAALAAWIGRKKFGKAAFQKMGAKGKTDEAKPKLGSGQRFDALVRSLSQRQDEQEVTPPGGEKVVKALKGKKGIDNPWAVAWSMKDKGYLAEDVDAQRARLVLNPVQARVAEQTGIPGSGMYGMAAEAA